VHRRSAWPPPSTPPQAVCVPASGHPTLLPRLRRTNEQDSTSYPSGHATYGMVTGLLLAEMLPEKRERIINRIVDFGYSRLVAGVHFRGDVYAGQIAGATIAVYLFKSDAARARFYEAKTNLRQALGIADNQKSRAGQAPEGNTEYYDEQKRKFEFWKQELSAEWEPTGIAEERAVLDLAYLYWQRDRILEEAARA
jgi:hypothetical protein